MISDDELAKDKSITVEQVRLLRESRGATNSTLQGMKEGALRRAIRRLDYPDLPRARQQQLLAVSRDDAGQVQPGALARALIEVSAMRRRLGATTRCAGVPAQRVVRPKALVGAASGLPVGEPVVAPAAGLAASSWVWLGPGNIGGRTRSVVIHPTQPQKMWAASAGGGIWHTQDGGAHWQPVDDMMANLAICCLAIDRKKPNILYAGSGEGFNNLDAIRGAGVFRTHRRRHVEAARGHRERRLPGGQPPGRLAVRHRRAGRHEFGAVPQPHRHAQDLDQGAHRADRRRQVPPAGSTRAQWRPGCSRARRTSPPTAARRGRRRRMRRGRAGSSWRMPSPIRGSSTRRCR